ERRPGRRADTVLLHIADDADDRERLEVAVHVAELDQLAERIFAGPPRLRERSADERDVRRVANVARVEEAASDERDAHRAEVVCARDTKVRVAGPRALA